MKRRLYLSLCAIVFAFGCALLPADVTSQTATVISAVSAEAEVAAAAAPTQVLEPPAAKSTDKVVKPSFAVHIAPLLEKHCVSCHSGAKPSGDLLLTFKTAEEIQQKVSSDKELFGRVVAMLSNKEMPPEDAETKLTDAERSLLVKWVYDDVLAINCDAGPNPGPFKLRRLNNREYANTIRDLLYLPADWDASADFPADERGVGFDNNGDTLTISPVLIEHYVSAAEKSVNFAMNNFGKGSRESQRKLNAPRAAYREDFADWQAEARVVVELFASRAYRRPASKDEVDDLMRFAAVSFAHDGESIDAASSLAMRAALMSPPFLFRLERDPDDDGSGKPYQINEFELANRLSYFLWASMPDEKLFAVAKEGNLRENLEAVVKRMLTDPKAISLTKDFAGQWLEIRGLHETTNCAPELLAAMKGETEQYFNHIVRENRSIMEFLNADYTFVNATLAKHYGIANVEGEEFQKIAVNPDERGGIFTQASFLTLTGKPLGASRRTSPVNRGKWILENIFNTVIPPPPPDVPSLAIDNGIELKGTVRQIFEQHRADPKCASCHARMDPFGFALENYDGYGKWRTQYNNVEVDASGEVDDRPFTTPKEFRAILAARQDQFRRALVEKLLQYALGRGIESYDKCAIDEISAAVQSEGDCFSSVVLNLVKSSPFQYARSSAIGKEQLAAAEEADAKVRAEAQAKAEIAARVAADAKELAAKGDIERRARVEALLKSFEERDAAEKKAEEEKKAAAEKAAADAKAAETEGKQ